MGVEGIAALANGTRSRTNHLRRLLRRTSFVGLLAMTVFVLLTPPPFWLRRHCEEAEGSCRARSLPSGDEANPHRQLPRAWSHLSKVLPP